MIVMENKETEEKTNFWKLILVERIFLKLVAEPTD